MWKQSRRRVAWKTFSPRPKLKRSIGEKLVFKRVVFKILIVWWEVDGSSMACSSIPFVTLSISCWLLILLYFCRIYFAYLFFFFSIDEKISNYFNIEISSETMERKIAVDFLQFHVKSSHFAFSFNSCLYPVSDWNSAERHFFLFFFFRKRGQFLMQNTSFRWKFIILCKFGLRINSIHPCFHVSLF